MYKVGIDAGHSIVTGGKKTPKLIANLKDSKGNVLRRKGEIIHEYEFNKKVAYALAEELQRCGIKTVFSGFSDTKDTSLTARANKLNAEKVDLVISCHYNAVATDVAFQTRICGLLVLKTKNCSSKSEVLAKNVHDELKTAIQPKRTFGVCRDVDMSGFTLAILRQTNAPACLIEYGFMDYWDEAKLMLDEAHIRKCAIGTAKGVCKTLGVKYVSSVSPKVENVPEPQIKDNSLPKYVKTKVTDLSFRSRPSWSSDAVQSILPLGTVLTVKEKIAVDGGFMFKTPYGYVTASTTYVEYIY